MKIVIIADIHGNYDALQALPEDYDELWVLGDLVNYGPQPAEVVSHVMAKASLVVQGNHDHAVAHDDDSRWSSRFRIVAETTRRFSASVLTDRQKSYLRGLPLHLHTERRGTRFYLVHATPADPHYGKWSPDDQACADQLKDLGADVVVVGHTHVPFIRKIGSTVLVNPGSIGQPRDGKNSASYAVWRDGAVELRSFRYPVADTIRKLRSLDLPRDVEAELVGFLEHASLF